MVSKLESLISNSISGLKKTDKPLPLRPKRPERLTNFFLLSSEPSSPELWGYGPCSALTSPQSLPLSSLETIPTRQPSFSGFTLAPSPPASLERRRYVEQKPPLVPKNIEERLTRLELENSNLRQANDVLYKQNLDYKGLLEEYRAFKEKAGARIDRCMGSVEVLEEVMEAIRANAKDFGTARTRLQRFERSAIKDWKRFVDVSAREGVKVDKVVEKIVEEHAMDITVYPYKKDPNMI